MKKIILFLMIFIISIATSCDYGDIADIVDVSESHIINDPLKSGNIAASQAFMADTDIIICENSVNDQIFGFVTFNIDSIDTMVDSASVRMYKSITVSDPSVLGSYINVDHTDFLTLGVGSESAAAISNSFTNFTVPADNTWIEFDVTDQLNQSITNDSSITQYRFSYPIDTGIPASVNKYIIFDSGTGKANKPELIVYY